MLKMRQWQGTLNRVRAVQRHRDVAIDGSIEVISQENLQDGDGFDSCSVFATHCRNGSQPLMGISAFSVGQQIEVCDKNEQLNNNTDDEDVNLDDFIIFILILNLFFSQYTGTMDKEYLWSLKGILN
jgi:hypothetical protein